MEMRIKISTVIASDVNNSLETRVENEKCQLKLFPTSTVAVPYSCKSQQPAENWKIGLHWWWISHARSDVVAIDDCYPARLLKIEFFNSLAFHTKAWINNAIFHHSLRCIITYLFFIVEECMRMHKGGSKMKFAEGFHSSLNRNYFSFHRSRGNAHGTGLSRRIFNAHWSICKSRKLKQFYKISFNIEWNGIKISRDISNFMSFKLRGKVRKF